MSVLSYPRIHFKGRCLINPPTGNNDDVVDAIDAVNVRLFPELANMDVHAARDYFLQGVQAISPINGKIHTYLRCAWNYFGDSFVRFQDVAVTSIVGLDGRQSCDDPIVGEGIDLVGSKSEDRRPTHPVICDVDPTGQAMSQLFVGGLRLGSGDTGLSADNDTRTYLRWLVWRNAEIYRGEQNFVDGGCTWQFGIPKNALKIQVGSSRVLAELGEAAHQHQGFLVQFCFYLPRPLISDTELLALFQAGSYCSNPAEAFLVGTIGVWEEDDLGTVPNGRLLQPPPPAENPIPTSVFPFPLGPAAARVHSDRPVVSLNLISTFPEANHDRPPRRKGYIGPVRLGLIPPSSARAIPISEPFAYGYRSYEHNGGIVDVPYDPKKVTPEQLKDGTLVVLADRYARPAWGPAAKAPPAHWRPILTEQYSTLTVNTDDGAVYLDTGDRRTIKLRVQERGGPPNQTVEISIWEYQFVLIPASPDQRASSALTLVAPGSPLEHRIGWQPTPLVVRPDRKGLVELEIRAICPGPVTLAFTLDGKPPADGFPGGAPAFIGVRVMPNDVFPDGPPSWDYLYDKVFKYYDFIYPAMSRIIPFHDQKAMEGAAPEIAARTDPDPKNWASTRYMPPTRDLSAGKRGLIVKWAESLAAKKGGK